MFVSHGLYKKSSVSDCAVGRMLCLCVTWLNLLKYAYDMRTLLNLWIFLKKNVMLIEGLWRDEINQPQDSNDSIWVGAVNTKKETKKV